MSLMSLLPLLSLCPELDTFVATLYDARLDEDVRHSAFSTRVRTPINHDIKPHERLCMPKMDQQGPLDGRLPMMGDWMA